MNTDHPASSVCPAAPATGHRGPQPPRLASPMAQLKTVGMGQIVVAQGTVVLTAVLGSCVAVVLHCRRKGVGAVAHVVLPDSAGRIASPDKFADTAIPAMLRQLADAGIGSGEVYARLVGGACMFGAQSPLQVGPANAEAACQALAKAGIPVNKRDVGGSKGRRISLYCDTGELLVEVLGESPYSL